MEVRPQSVSYTHLDVYKRQGLAIGLEHGFIAVTRLGVKSEMIRCCISRTVLASEAEQQNCNGRQTSIGPTLDQHAPPQFRDLFGSNRKRSDFDYAAAEEALNPKDDGKKTSNSGSCLLYTSRCV